jgi:hypothetical protein
LPAGTRMSTWWLWRSLVVCVCVTGSCTCSPRGISSKWHANALSLFATAIGAQILSTLRLAGLQSFLCSYSALHPAGFFVHPPENGRPCPVEENMLVSGQDESLKRHC